MSFFRRGMQLFVCALLCGCSSFSTSDRPLSSARVSGQFYYLPQGKLRLTGEWKNISTRGYTSFVVTVTEEMEADPAARYYLRPEGNPLYDDETQLTINAKGLLTTVDATSEDRTQAVLATAAGAGADALEFAAGGGVDNVNPQAVGENVPRFKPFALVFDPADKEETSQTARRLENCGFHLKVVEQMPRGVALPAGQWRPAADTLAHGVIFRPLKPWRIILDSNDDSLGAVRESKLVHLPDKAHPLILDFSRVPFVKKVQSVTFVDGTLRDYSRKVPSPILGFLGIPKALLGAIAPLPVQLKQTQITTLRADETLRKLRPPSVAE